MPLLKDMMESKINLVDYERIVDEQGRRLIFFGRFAGLAGMINSLWSLGQRYAEYGIHTPFLKIQQTHHYNSLEEVKQVIGEVGDEIKKNGLPSEITPLTFAITGYGNVSKGAQEILKLLPVVNISPSKMKEIGKQGTYSNNEVYQAVFKEEDLSRPKDPRVEFNLQNYYDHPELFEDQFEQYIPFISCLMNCMYWDDRYPRIVTKNYLEKIYKQGNPKLTVIGDVTCDPNGSIECTHKGTEIEDPVFTYNPFSREPIMGFKGEGILVMAVDILPSELPRESSQTFSDALVSFIPQIAAANFNEPFENLNLPYPIKKALILHNGKLTPDYQYLKENLTL
jgi:alpha-aminoadipic semialdehyde synthase